MRVINCVCGYRLEVPDGGDVATAMKAHSDQARDALRSDGMAVAGSYPPREASSSARAYHGTVRMYEAAGFIQHREHGPYSSCGRRSRRPPRP